jgi:hypothetical protein
MNQVRSYKRLAILRLGIGIPCRYGTATSTSQYGATNYRVVLLEHIADAIGLSDIIACPELAKFIPPCLTKSIESTFSAFGRLGVVHHDINPGNRLFSVKTAHSVGFDSGGAYIREGEIDPEWRETMEEGDIDNAMFD